jgi:hypothetical protein
MYSTSRGSLSPRAAIAAAFLGAFVGGCGGSTTNGATPAPDAGATGDSGAARDSGATPDSASESDSGSASDSSAASDTSASADVTSALDGSACALDPPGAKFVFHVHNAGTRMLSLAYGCGGALPIVLQTPQGMLHSGPGPEDRCEFTCDVVYGTAGNIGCTDCGPGVGTSLAPGMTADISWDRRGYQEIMTDPVCTGGASASCARGTTVAPIASQMGVLTVCTGAPVAAGWCATTDTVTFSVDTTLTEGTIDVP